jgi:hypothetical protein
MSRLNTERFRKAYEEALAHYVLTKPEDYDYHVGDVPRVVDKMVPSYAKGEASPSPAMRRAAKACGIPGTLSAVRAFLTAPESIDVSKWLGGEVYRAASAAHLSMMRSAATVGITLELYLYYKHGELRFAADKPEGFELACPERAPTHLTAEQFVAWTRARSMRLPCLPEES